MAKMRPDDPKNPSLTIPNFPTTPCLYSQLKTIIQDNDVESFKTIWTLYQSQKQPVQHTFQHPSPIHWACLYGSLPILQYLASQDNSMNSRSTFNIELLLNTAASAGHHHCVAFLLSHGADIHQRDAKGMTALLCSARSGSVSSMNVLISNGADPHCRDNNNQTILHMALLAASPDCVRTALQLGCDPETPIAFGIPPAHYAVENQLHECLQLLLEYKANVNSRDSEQNWTPVHLATYLWDYKALRLLLVAGADVNARSFTDDTPLHILLTSEHMDSLSLADSSISDLVSFEKCVRLLIAFGANTALRNHDGCSPVHILQSCEPLLHLVPNFQSLMDDFHKNIPGKRTLMALCRKVIVSSFRDIDVQQFPFPPHVKEFLLPSME